MIRYVIFTSLWAKREKNWWKLELVLGCADCSYCVTGTQRHSSQLQTLRNPESGLKTHMPCLKTHKRIWHLWIIITVPVVAATTLMSYPWLPAVFLACISQLESTFWSWNLRISCVRGSQERDVSEKAHILHN